ANRPRTPAQIGIQLVPQVAVHEVATLLLRHHLKSGILGQAFRNHVGTLHVGADELMGPPLMAEFMRSNEVGEVDVGGFLNSADEADRFRVGNGIGKGLREGAVAGKLEDAELRELEGTVDGLVEIKPSGEAAQNVSE